MSEDFAEGVMIFIASVAIIFPWVWLGLVLITNGRPYWPDIKALFRGRR